jgi:hypothetical protein
MNALGWMDQSHSPDYMTREEAEERKVAHGCEHCRELPILAIVPADEWDALTDVDAAVERAARARCHELGRTWDLLPDHMHDEWRRFVRPIVLAALGITE